MQAIVGEEQRDIAVPSDWRLALLADSRSQYPRDSLKPNGQWQNWSSLNADEPSELEPNRYISISLSRLVAMRPN